MLSTISQISGAIANIVLDYIFIYPLNMGVAGAAWATIIGQFISLFIAMYFHYKKNSEINGNIKYIKPDKNLIKGIYSIGVSAALMQALLAVMMGRSADYILEKNKNLVKVFIYAPMDYRIKNIMKNYGDNEKQAKSHILNSDKARSNYYSAISNRTWGDKNNYDLCIDAKIGNENVVRIICDYVKNR